MKVILHVIAILAIGGAAFFSLDLSDKLNSEQKVRLETIQTNKQLTASIDATQKEIDDKTVIRDGTQQDLDLVNAEIESRRSDQQALARQIAQLDGEIEEQAAELAQANEALKEVNLILESIGGGADIDNLGEKVQEIESQKADREARLAELEELVIGAERALERSRADSNRLATRKVERNARLSRNATEARLTSVNSDYGFVIIGAGSNTGFTPETALLVKRDGRMIGRVKPTSIEPNQTVADIDQDSVAPGVRLMPGDQVILATPRTN